MISRAGIGVADLPCASGAFAHGLIIKMVTTTATAAQKTSANLVLAAMSAS
jgi:hypothetical protein